MYFLLIICYNGVVAFIVSNFFLIQTDADINRLMAGLTDNQKRYAKYAEKLSKVHDVSHQVKKCHMLLSQTLESLNTLNNCLPLEDRLEPFFWSAS